MLIVHHGNRQQVVTSDLIGDVTGKNNLIGDPATAGGLQHDANGTGDQNVVGQDDGGNRVLLDVSNVLGGMLIEGMADIVHAPCRVTEPMVRKGFLDHGHRSNGAGRGVELRPVAARLAPAASDSATSAP